MVSICISLIFSDAEHFFTYLLVIYLSFVEKCLLQPFAHYLIGFLVCFIMIIFCYCRSSLYILEIKLLPDIDIMRNILSNSRLLVHSFSCFLCCVEPLQFDVLPLVCCSFSYLCFWYLNHEIIAKTNVMKITPYVFFQQFYSFRLCI